MASLMPVAKQQYFFPGTALPLVGGKLYTYAAGTSTPKNTYQDPAGTTPNTNPITLDSAGSALIYWDGAYKIVLKDALGNTIYTVDNYQPSVAFSDLSGNTATTLINGTWFNNVIAKVSDLGTSIGASLLGFLQAGAGAVLQSVQGKLRLREMDVEDFGAVGDGVADDWAAITACFAAAKARGRNVTVRMSQRYKISKGLKLPSHVRIKGPMSVRYPYNNASPAPALVANFTDPNQWVIEPETTSGGLSVGYNTLLTGLPDGATYNCAVEDLLIISTGVTPYGAIRMHGCPGSYVRNVSTLGTGIGLLVNECYGGEYQLHGEALYYGAIMWGEANANYLDAYYDQTSPRVKTVPAGYLFPGISSLNGTFVSTLKLSTEAHYNRPFGAVVGSTTSTSSNDEIAVTVEGFSGGLFMYNARSVTSPRFYVEGNAGEVDFGIVAASSSMASMGIHAYLSGTGTLFDLGANIFGDVILDGIISYATFKPAKLDSSSRVIIRGISMASALQTTPEPNVRFPDDPGNWIAPTLLNGWTNAGGANAPVGYRINPLTWRTEFRGVAISGTENASAFVVPAGYRSLYKGAVPATITGATATVGTVIFLATGEVIPATTGMSANGFDLSSLSFRAEQ
jgi:hypothetical protein